jgi:transposase
MANDFLPVDRGQQWLMPPSVDDWLPADHGARFVVDAVDVLDLCEFVARHPLGGAGRRAYHPAVMVGVLLWAYANGVFSSREIERRCVSDVAFRFVAANHCPDHGTIARFRAACEAELRGLHTQVLGLCADLGLVQLGLVALDGTKIAANASLDANRSAAWLDEEIARWFEQAAAADAAEDERFGDARGDEMPEGLADRDERLRRLRQARERVAQVETARAASRKGTRNTKPATGNTTDPASALMPTRGGGFLQGYNAQAVATSTGVVLATGVGSNPSDVGYFCPLLAAARNALANAGVDGQLGVVVGDAGYWSAANATADVGAAETLIATDQTFRKTKTAADMGGAEPEPPPADDRYERRLDAMQRWEAGELDIHGAMAAMGLSLPRAYELRAEFRRRGPDGLRPRRAATRAPAAPTARQRIKHDMRIKLTSERGKTLYKQRAPTIEGVFAQTKHNRRFRRFSRRGLTAVNAEWSLVHTVGNLTKVRTALNALTTLFAGPVPGAAT